MQGYFDAHGSIIKFGSIDAQHTRILGQNAQIGLSGLVITMNWLEFKQNFKVLIKGLLHFLIFKHELIELWQDFMKMHWMYSTVKSSISFCQPPPPPPLIGSGVSWGSSKFHFE